MFPSRRDAGGGPGGCVRLVPGSPRRRHRPRATVRPRRLSVSPRRRQGRPDGGGTGPRSRSLLPPPRTLPGASPKTTLPRCCRPLRSSTSIPSPRSISTVTAGYGTTLRSTGSVARSRNPAMLTPGSRPDRDGVAMSHLAAASGADSADPIAPGYEPLPGVGRRRDIPPRRSPAHGRTLTSRNPDQKGHPVLRSNDRPVHAGRRARRRHTPQGGEPRRGRRHLPRADR
jgi:hypothetical protein